jgi:mono/diheme cytochrome c family protein
MRMPDPRLTVLALALAVLPAGPALAADGAALYKANCAGCHGADGKADSATAKAMKVPALAGTKLSAEDVVKHVKSSPRHKSLAAKLSDEELAAIAAALPR